MKNYAIYVNGVVAFVTMNEECFNRKLVEYKKKYNDVKFACWFD